VSFVNWNAPLVVLIHRLQQVLLLLGMPLVDPMWISVVESVSRSGSKRWNTNVRRRFNYGVLSTL
jgi:hypothetical protein